MCVWGVGDVRDQAAVEGGPVEPDDEVDQVKDPDPPPASCRQPFRQPTRQGKKRGDEGRRKVRRDAGTREEKRREKRRRDFADGGKGGRLPPHDG